LVYNIKKLLTTVSSISKEKEIVADSLGDLQSIVSLVASLSIIHSQMKPAKLRKNLERLRAQKKRNPNRKRSDPER